MTADLWTLATAGLVLGGAAAWLMRRRAPVLPPDAPADTPTAGLPTRDGLGPRRGPPQN